MALTWLVMVDAYLRPGECVDLCVSQVLHATQIKHMRSVALLLHPDERGIASKTGERNESLLLQRSWLGRHISTWAKHRRQEKLWDFNLAEMRTIFNQIAASLSLSRWKPVLYMGRHSGASLDRLTDNLPLAEVQKRGRWRSEASVRRYEKRALVQEVYLGLPNNIKAIAHRSEAALEKLLDRLMLARFGSRGAMTGTSHS